MTPVIPNTIKASSRMAKAGVEAGAKILGVWTTPLPPAVAFGVVKTVIVVANRSSRHAIPSMSRVSTVVAAEGSRASPRSPRAAALAAFDRPNRG